MLRHTLICLSAIATLCLSAHARLGDSQAEIENQYGKSIKTEATTAVVMDMLLQDLELRSSDKLPRMNCCAYAKENWIVAVVYLDEKSVAETYSKRDSFTIEESEIVLFLKSNSGNKKWHRHIRLSDDQHNRKWDLIGVDSVVEATAKLGGRSFTVVLPSFTAYVNETREGAFKQDAERKRKALIELTGVDEAVNEQPPKSSSIPFDASTETVIPTAMPPSPAILPRYVVVGVSPNDLLNVRSEPVMSSSVVFQLANGDKVQCIGRSSYNGDTEWIPISVGSQNGWVRNKYLRLQSE